MLIIFLFILGTAVGSFLNVLIDRLPQEQKITGRSKCDYCRKTLAWYDLIPLVSFFLLQGRCRYCHKKLSWQYPLVEVLTGVMFLLVAIFLNRAGHFLEISNIDIKNKIFFDTALLLIYLSLVSTLIAIFFSDLKYQIIPDSLQLAFFVFSLFLHLVSIFPNYQLLITKYLPAGFLVMLPILFIWLVTAGRGMGFGDVKLAFNIGFLLGIKPGFLALYFGFIIGAIVGLILIVFKKKKLKSKIAFGPFLVLGIVIMLFWQKEVFEIINKIYGI